VSGYFGCTLDKLWVAIKPLRSRYGLRKQGAHIFATHAPGIALTLRGDRLDGHTVYRLPEYASRPTQCAIAHAVLDGGEHPDAIALT
jgi:hypothetical protein